MVTLVLVWLLACVILVLAWATGVIGVDDGE
jgi:cytochrome c oxidase assembly factor CtaG